MLLDAAAFTPTNRLDLNQHKPEFICLSFYKMLGFPTGIGCLIARKNAIAEWRQHWFAGGNVKFTSVSIDRAIPADGPAAFEDGTLDFLMIPAVTAGLAELRTIGITTIHQRVRALTAWTLEQMLPLKHASGLPLATILGPANTTDRGGTLSFVLQDPSGKRHDIRRVCALAAQQGLALRSGCFCNPGAGETAFGVTGEMVRPMFEAGHGFNFDQMREFLRRTQGLDIGAIRASYGLVSDFSDAWSLLQFLHQFLNTTRTALGTDPDKLMPTDELDAGG